MESNCAVCGKPTPAEECPCADRLGVPPTYRYRREQIATAVLAALVNAQPNGEVRLTALVAVAHADMLIAELDK